MKINRIIKQRLCLMGTILLSFFFIAVGCSDDDNTDNSKTEWLRILPLQLDFPDVGGTKEVRIYVTDDVDVNNVVCKVAAQGQDWCEISKDGDLLTVVIEPNYMKLARATIVTFSYGEYNREVPITQVGTKGTLKLEVVGATATSEETETEARDLKYSYDGTTETWFNSKFGVISTWPFEIEYTLNAKAERLDYIQYHPRSDTGNKWGAFNKYTVYATTREKPNTYIKIGDYERGNGNFTIHRIDLDTPIEHPAKVKFEIWSAYENRVSCAEMEFYQVSSLTFDYSKIFADPLATELLPGITESDIRKIPDEEYKKLAIALFNNAYDANEFRVNQFRPYQDPAIMANINKTEHYSLRDNPTGIYVESNDEVFVIVGDTHGQSISMVVQDLGNGYGSSKTYLLEEGRNLIKVNSGGLIYIQNITQDDIPLVLTTDNDKAKAEAKTVGMHFVFGKTNGYFDSQKHTMTDWTTMLSNARYKDMDVIGKYAHITWAVADFRDANTNIVSVIDQVDRMVYIQQEFMGLVKYDKMFRNRMYIHLDYNGASPYATRNRTAFTRSYSELFCKDHRFAPRIWGAAHEVGHINQTRPGLKWTGTTEVTNNIHTMYCQQQFGEPSKLLVDNFYQRAKESIIDTNSPHCLGTPFEIKLVPFWQLKLYMIEALGKDDFYKDLYEHYRVTTNLNTSSTTEGILQLDFVRQVCRISGLNMLEFFEAWGFLTPVDTVLDDYGKKNFKITQAQIDALVSEINAKGYALPKPNVHLITEENINSYK